jgi:NADPH-dependent 2,4-dienoyl-CoA reductase/sulfur reductase-like enzyme
MLLVASQLSYAGVPIKALLDTTPRENYFRAARYSPGALRNLKLLLKGVGLLRSLKRSGVPHITGVESLRAESGKDDHLDKVYYRRKGVDHELDCRSLLVHQGVVPNVQLTRALELKHRWNDQQQCWNPHVDVWGETSRAGIFVAGDSSGIAGAQAAEEAGRLSVLQIAKQLGQLEEDTRNKRAVPIRRRLGPHQAIRPFLDVLYQPARPFLIPEDDTIVCRCEEITAGELRSIADAGCQGPNQAKAFCRAGMGPCQGRLCGLTVSQVLAERNNQSIDAVGYYHIRPPIKPLTIGELADIAN